MVVDLEGLAVEGDHFQAPAVPGQPWPDSRVQQVVDALQGGIGIPAGGQWGHIPGLVLRQFEFLDGLADGIDEVAPFRGGFLVHGDEAVHVEHRGHFA